MNRPTIVLAALLAALALATSAAASPIPVVQGVSATGIDADSQLHRNEIAVSWQLGSNEYACSITYSSPAAERNVALQPTQTSSTETLSTTPGQTITVVLSFVSVAPTTQPGDACFQSRATMTATATAQAYQPPAPPPAEPAPAPAPTEPTAEPSPPSTGDPSPPAGETSEPAPGTAELEARVAELGAALAAIAAKVAGIENATLASWTALVDALAAGATPDVAALAARSAYLNVLHDLG